MGRFTVGKLANAGGVGVETIRYYERRGLMPEPYRAPSGYRLYGEPDLRRIRFIRRAQGLGFKLAEIRELLSLRASNGATCAQVCERAKARLADIDRRLADLGRMRQALSELIVSCQADSAPATACRVLGALEPEQEEDADPS